jgi:hypothetical protein
MGEIKSMKSILAGLMAFIIFFSGIGTVTISKEIEDNNLSFSICFSDPILENNDFFTITLSEANAVTIQPNEPLLPMYKKTFVLSDDILIDSIEIIPLGIIEVGKITHPIVCAPEVSIPDMTVTDLQYSTYLRSPQEQSITFPMTWYEYTINRGISQGRSSLRVSINCYPIRIINNTVFFVHDFSINIKTSQVESTISNPEDESLLILAPQEFTDLLNPFVEHKESKGIQTTLVTLESIYDSSIFPVQGRDDAEKVKFFIKNAYDSWHIKYVLLVGGRKPGLTESWFIPVRYVHVSWAEETKFMSDLYFADIYTSNNSFSSWDSDNDSIFSYWPSTGDLKDELDLYPEVLIGRWPCRNTFELRIIIQKTIAYENMQLQKKIVLVGGDNFEEPGIEGEIVCDKSLEYLDDFTNAKVYASEMDVTPAHMREALGNGAMFMHMHGHGSPVKWGTHPPDSFDGWMDGLYITDVPWFFNEEYPILILGGCHTAMFNVSLFNRPWIYGYKPTPEGLGWWFARKIGGGGIATVGYTCFPVASPGEYGDLNGDGINEPDCVESGYGFMQLQFLKGYGKEHQSYLGECWAYAISTYLDTYKIPYEPWHFHTSEGFVLLGDPSLKIGGY